MPFPAAHNVLQIYGKHASGTYEDIWTMSLRLGREGASGAFFTGDATAGHIADIKADLQAWWDSMAVHFPTTVRMLGFKFNAVGTDGRYISQEGSLGATFGAAGVAGTASGTQLPPQVSLVATLHTNVARGLASTGRIYLPPFAVTNVVAGGVLNTADAPVHARRLALLLTNLSNWPGLDVAGDAGDVVVASKVRAGAMRRVTGVTVGTVFDTQRRRRSAYREIRHPIEPVT